MKKSVLFKKLAFGIAFLLFAVVLATSCSQEDRVGFVNRSDAEAAEATESYEAPAESELGYLKTANGTFTVQGSTNGDVGNVPAHKNLKIIKSGSIQFQVEKLAKAKAELNFLVNKYQAYYAKEELDQQSYQNVYQLAIRIPSQNYEHFLQDLEKKNLGKLLDKRVEAQDVSEEYTDLETRLKNKRSYIERYTALLKQAKTMDDILKIQEKIRALEEEIDRAAGRLRFLSDRVSMGSLNVMLQENIEVERVEIEEPTFWDRFAKSLGYGWNGVLQFVLGITTVWPIVLGVVIFFFLFRKWRKKSKKKA